MATHRPFGDDDVPPTIAFASRVEYVGGPRDEQLEDRDEMPKLIVIDGGEYRRSVRCAEDGAMRYVWHSAAGPDRRTADG